MISTFERLRAILVKDYQLAPDTVTMQANLESLGIDSLGVAELLFSIEDEYRVTLPPEPAELNTVGEVVDYIDALVAGRRPTALQPLAQRHVVHSPASQVHAQASASSTPSDTGSALPSPHMQ
jgi:acyl carrier protein